MRRRTAAIAVVATAVAWGTSARAEDPPKKVVIALADVGEPVPFDPHADGSTVRATAAGRVTYVAKRGANVVVVVDGKPGKEWTKVGGLVPSADGRRFAHWAQDGEAWFVVLEGEARAVNGKPMILLDDGLTLSADGMHVAYAVRRGDEVVVALDGVEGPPAPAAGAFDVTMSRDGKHVAYAAPVLPPGAKPDPSAREGLRVVVDGKPLEAVHKGVGDMAFSPDGKRFAYVVDEKDTRVVVADGKRGTPYEDVRGLQFTEDGRLVYEARKARDQEVVVVEGKEGTPYQTILDVAVAPGGKKIAYGARKVFRTPKDQVCTVVIDGKEGPEVGLVHGLRWSADGSRVAYVAQTPGGRSRVMVGDQAGPEHEAVMAGALTLSPDGKRVAYVARAGKKFAPVVDGVAWKEADAVAAGSPVFGPDGATAAALVLRGKGAVSLVVEGEEVALPGAVLGGMMFQDASTVDLVVVEPVPPLKMQRMRATVTRP